MYSISGSSSIAACLGQTLVQYTVHYIKLCTRILSYFQVQHQLNVSSVVRVRFLYLAETDYLTQHLNSCYFLRKTSCLCETFDVNFELYNNDYMWL